MFNSSYEELCKKVGKISPETEMYMRTEAPKLSSFIQASKLGSCFIWHNTPQGRDFWANLSATFDL